MIAAVQDRNENRLRSLLQSGADVNGFDPAFGNAMHYIATQGHYQYPPNGIPKVCKWALVYFLTSIPKKVKNLFIQMLVNSGVDLDAKDPKVEHPFTQAGSFYSI